MTQILFPMRDKLRSLNDLKSINASYRMKLCWTCQKDKPKAGGSFPERGVGTGKGAKYNERFRCGDCTAARLARRALKDQDETRSA